MFSLSFSYNKKHTLEDMVQKLEQLEIAMGTAQEDGISHLSIDIVHYDPTNLYSQFQSMLTELNPPPTITTVNAIWNCAPPLGLNKGSRLGLWG